MGAWIGELKPIEADTKDNELTKLLKQRYNTAIEELGDWNKLYAGGRISLESVNEAVQRVAAAGVEVAQTQAERGRVASHSDNWSYNQSG